MKSQYRLYIKISAAFFTLLVLLGVVYVLISTFISQRYYQEVNQKLYGGIADSTVQVVKPLIDGRVDTAGIQDIMHSMMVINPSVEVYLLDTAGRIITYVAPNKRVKLEEVNLEPLRTFIATQGTSYIMGDDPRHPGEKKVFSAAPIRTDNDLEGYLYIILASEEQSAVGKTLQGSYILQMGMRTFLLSLVLAMVLGLLVLWLLTRHLRRIIHIVQQFRDGDYQARIPEKDKGDFGLLADTFNEMAARIQESIDNLRSVETLRRELIANVSHDLRTPLAIMQGYVETLQMKAEEFTLEQRQKYLQVVMDSSERLSRLIEQLFEYSKLEAKQVEPHKESFFLSDLVQDVVQKYQLLARDKDIDLELQASPGLPLVFADVGLVERVIQNLLDNALKFTPGGGKVVMSLQEKEKHIEVRISDTGPGISAQEQSFIFERYRKGAGGQKVSSGSGLGLAIARKILELHDAGIRVQSKVNEGTAFIFQLPAHSAF